MFKRPLFIVSLAVATVFISACKSSNAVLAEEESQGPGVHFVKTTKLSEALDKAAKEDKLVFVDIYTDWCLPCKLMDEDVFPDEQIAEILNENFINFKLDAEKNDGPILSELYQVQVYPTLLFLDTKGNIIVRKDGAAFHSELTNLANLALSNQDIGCLIGS